MRNDHYQHDRILDDLVAKLRTSRLGSTTTPHFMYPFGEVDILNYWIEWRQTISSSLPTYHFNFYEVKTHDHQWARSKARLQLARFGDYLERKFRREDKLLVPHYVYGTFGDNYMIADLGSHDGLELKIGGIENGKRKNIK